MLDRCSAALCCAAVLLAGCEKKTAVEPPGVPEPSGPPRKPGERPQENIDAQERAEAAKLKPGVDEIRREINASRLVNRLAYDNRRFEELEKTAAELRASKATFGDGSWKLEQFYESFRCGDEEPESRWELHHQIHRAWVEAKPESVTARVAYADFLTQYAWRARGGNAAKNITAEKRRLYEDRLDAASVVLISVRRLPEKDMYWYAVALGKGPFRSEYDDLVEEAKAFEPKYWGYDTARAFSLLPRWDGRAGDWEAYAEKAAARPDGLGPEGYARIVMHLRRYYENVFRETKASWPKTREGLEQLRQRYPDSLEIVSHTAMLAAIAGERPLAKEMFDRLGDFYVPAVWGNPGRFTHCRHWAQTEAVVNVFRGFENWRRS